MEKTRSRTFMILLYPDNEQHLLALEKIKSSYDYALILHNKDYNEDGEIKKAHYHIIVRFSQAKWSSALSSELNIESNYLQDVRKFDNAMQYLIHYNDKDKAQYNIEDVQGPLRTKLVESINKIEKSEGEKVTELLAYINEQDKTITITEFAYHCATQGFWAEFRRSGSIFIKIIEEHNFYIREKEKRNC